ncbi:succinyldiaminopimelate aminotransferase [Paraphotobacterium marinum]|uniref:2-oxoadipate dioxygenase/decarboxylase n=1 Tax=Paraphotobacterium marinum TaxID=1755811 RepID=A0A220VCR2_9GAMM|nr:DUF1338 domain-containing protein [Paraphotobacterium marinum]ASK78016.1 succinyldiaminopimelate aminotransferase [Paraphotobacterium marinum]
MVKQFISNLWLDYSVRLCPSSSNIHHIVGDYGSITTDHFALRTLNLPQINVQSISLLLQNIGYKSKASYIFRKKKLYAEHFEHIDKKLPKIFLSQLNLQDCSKSLQKFCLDKFTKMSFDHTNIDFLFSGKTWDISINDYEKFLKESEYAAWFLAHGFGANHFTISVNALNKIKSLSELNEILIQNKIIMNKNGGLIKGSEALGLEQSSTLADHVQVQFSDGFFYIPGGFYEFSQRYKSIDSGRIFNGFIEASADKIFESTNRL